MMEKPREFNEALVNFLKKYRPVPESS